MTSREVAMDKPRHPQVIRPWKIQPFEKAKFQAPAKNELRHAHEGKTRKPFEKKTTGS